MVFFKLVKHKTVITNNESRDVVRSKIMQEMDILVLKGIMML